MDGFRSADLIHGQDIRFVLTHYRAQILIFFVEVVIRAGAKTRIDAIKQQIVMHHRECILGMRVPGKRE